ncbi:helix-turn-helix transcriptional regulator [Muricauda sp. NFXS6]
MLQLRNMQKLSQEELSEMSGISVRTIQRIERGEVTPRPYTIRKLAEVLHTTLDEFNTEMVKETDSGLSSDAKLNRFFMANLLVLTFPIVFLLVPFVIWKNNDWSAESSLICKKVLSFQVIWICFTAIMVFLTPLFINFFDGQYVVGKLFPTPILVYFGLSGIAVLVVFQINRSIKNNSSNWTSLIPLLF